MFNTTALYTFTSMFLCILSKIESRYFFFNITYVANFHLVYFIMITFFEMIYITFKRRPLPCISVKLKILPPEIDFSILVVAAPIFGFFVFAETAIPIYGLAIFNAGFKNLLQAVCVPLKIFCSLDLMDPPSSIY